MNNRLCSRPVPRQAYRFPLLSPFLQFPRGTVRFAHESVIRGQFLADSENTRSYAERRQARRAVKLDSTPYTRGQMSLSNFSGAAIQPMGGLGPGEGGDGTGKEGLCGGGCSPESAYCTAVNASMRPSPWTYLSASV